jgi:hypothetical protein
MLHENIFTNISIVGPTMKRETLVVSLIRTFGIMGILFAVAGFALDTHYVFTRPQVPDEAAGYIYPISVHGTLYVTRGEERLHSAILIGWMACLIPCALMIYFEIIRRKQKGL